MTPRRILVVDDHALSRRLLERLLGRAGHETDAVASVAAGADSAIRRAPDAIVLDLHLGDGDGLELVRRLRRDPRTAATPIVACTAAAGEAARAAALAAGCDAYVTKPIDLEAFDALIASLLAGAPVAPPAEALALR